MGLRGAVHWWEESQMRVLVLSSLVVQFLLLIFSFVRRSAIHWVVRSIMWLAYLASDAVAIYALATLFNRHKDDQDRGGGGSALEVVWAPVLLLHLGGHDGITAYNIEDNELWSRHLVTAVSQVTVAIYVFYKSWPGGDKRLLQAAILLFVPGILKCFAKPWALKSASINSLVGSSSHAERTAKQNEGEMDPVEVYVKQAKAFVLEQKGEQHGGSDTNPTQDRRRRRRRQRKRDDAPHAKQNEGEMDPGKEYVKGARAFVITEQKDECEAHGTSAVAEDGDRPPTQQQSAHTNSFNERQELLKKEGTRILGDEVNKLFVDLSSPYPHRLSILKYFWVLSKEEAYGSVQKGIAGAFLLIYTKIKTAGIVSPMVKMEKGSSLWKLMCGQWIKILRMVLPWAAIALFHKSHRGAYSDIDVKITYVTFCCTALFEGYSSFPLMFTALTDDDDMPLMSGEQWPEMVAQYSLIGYFARNKNHSTMMWTVSSFGCKEILDQRWCMQSCFSSGWITELVLQHLKDGWKETIEDAASYRKFSDSRGHRALQGNQHLSWSIKGPFDESVLIWHIATDICFFSSPFSEHMCAFAKIPSIFSDSDSESEGNTTPGQVAPKCGELTDCKAVQCRQMSNYMMYLLFVNPEMLLPGTRRNLFTSAYKELKDILRDSKPPVKEKGLMEGLISTMEDRSKKAAEEKSKVPEEEAKDILRDSKHKLAPVKQKGLLGGLISTMKDRSKKAAEEKSKVPQEESKGGSEEKFIDDAWDLAQGLLDLGDDQKMWKVIQGVWVEMLCYSASRCRGHLHAKALGSGGEFLTYVWLLLSYMGAETLTERLQREREEPPSRPEGNKKGTSSSTSKIRTRAAPSTSEGHTSASPSTYQHCIDVPPEDIMPGN